MNLDQVFWTLLQAGLWQKALPCLDTLLSDEKWQELYAMALRQSVEGIVFDGMMSLPEEQRPNKSLLLLWYGRVKIIEQTHRQLNHGLVEIVSRLESEGMQPVLLKGQGNASFYPNPVHRECGDIDLFIGRQNYPRVCELLRAWGIEDALETIMHMRGEWKGVRIELHRIATLCRNPFKHKRIVEWSEAILKDRSTTFVPTFESKPISIPKPDFNVFFVFYHMLHHFTTSGVGLRQLCDLARLLHTYLGELDLPELNKQLNYYGLMRFWQAFGYLLVHRIGLPQNEMPFYKDTKKLSEKILDIINYDGNFGYYAPVERERKYTSYLGHKWDSLLIVSHRYFRLMRIFPWWGFMNYVSFVTHGTIMAIVGLFKKKEI